MLRPHQIKTVEYGALHPRFLDASEMGCGKSLSALYMLNESGLPGLIICPAYLTRNWINEAKKWFPGMNIVAWDKKLTTTLIRQTTILVLSYERITREPDLAKGRKFLIVDEAHYLSSATSQRSRAIFAINKKVDRLVLLSGTPMKKSPEDLYVMLKMLDEDGAFSSEFRTLGGFRNHFMHETVLHLGGRLVTKYYGLKNEKTLNYFLKKRYIKHNIDDLADIPEMSVVEVEVGELSKAIDEQLRAQFDRYEAGKDVVGDSVSSVKKANAILKSDATIEFVKDLLEQGEQAVVFTDHRDPCEKIANALKCPFIRGETSHENRQRYVQDFQDKKINCIVLSIGAASLGITLTSGRIVVFNDLAWNPSSNDQAMGRIRRIGQQKKTICYILCRPGIDAEIAAKLSRKRKEIKHVERYDEIEAEEFARYLCSLEDIFIRYSGLHNMRS